MNKNLVTSPNRPETKNNSASEGQQITALHGGNSSL
jgi:hypothetical protein